MWEEHLLLGNYYAERRYVIYNYSIETWDQKFFSLVQATPSLGLIIMWEEST